VRLGSYELDSKAALFGGQAFVHFGHDILTGERVAVKRARPSEWSRNRMKREIKVQRTLEHPNVLPILDADADDRWYAMRAADQSLEDYGPLPRANWMRLSAGLLGISDALRYAHGLGYIHRDISPGNILIFRDRWVLADWGFVYHRDGPGPRLTRPLEHFGHPDFTSPEMLLDPRRVGPLSDVFSLGRVARWGTGLTADQGRPDDPPDVRWWRTLIEGTSPWEPESRWTLDDVITHLRKTPALPRDARPPTMMRDILNPQVAVSVSRPRVTFDQCPNCGTYEGRDSQERCLSCRVSTAY
jgi:serine/threonine protein kinase